MQNNFPHALFGHNLHFLIHLEGNQLALQYSIDLDYSYHEKAHSTKGITNRQRSHFQKEHPDNGPATGCFTEFGFSTRKSRQGGYPSTACGAAAFNFRPNKEKKWFA